VWQRGIDTAHDDRAWIIPVDDEDLAALVEEHKQSSLEGGFDSLRAALNRLIMQMVPVEITGNGKYSRGAVFVTG